MAWPRRSAASVSLPSAASTEAVSSCALAMIAPTPIGLFRGLVSRVGLEVGRPAWMLYALLLRAVSELLIAPVNFAVAAYGVLVTMVAGRPGGFSPVWTGQKG